MELKEKLGQSSVNGLLNNSSSVNPLPLPDIMKVDSLRGKNVLVKQPIKMVIVMVMHYFHSVLEHTTPLLELEPQYLFNASTHSLRRESMARGTRNISTLPELSECTIHVLR